MGPDEIERVLRGKAGRVAGVEPLVDVPRHAGDAQLPAHVAAGAAAAHRVEDQALRLEVQQQVLDQVAAAVAGPAAVAVLAGPVEVVQAGQVRHRAGVLRRPGQPGVDRLLRLGPPLWPRRGLRSGGAARLKRAAKKGLMAVAVFMVAIPFRLVVVEGQAEFGELAFQLLEVFVEGRVDAHIGVVLERSR